VRQGVALLAIAVAAVLFAAPVASATVRERIVTDQVTLRSFPDEYVIGNAFGSSSDPNAGWTMDVQGPEVNGYRWGYVWGHFNGCAWIASSAVVDAPERGAPQTRCAANPQPDGTHPAVSGFTNGEVHCNRTPDGKCDGISRHIDYSLPGCYGSPYEFWNARPWYGDLNSGDSSQGTDSANRVLPNGAQVMLRYTARTGFWAMVRDPYLSNTLGAGKGWLFVPRSCIGST
jgi:hypothetical protein